MLTMLKCPGVDVSFHSLRRCIVLAVGQANSLTLEYVPIDTKIVKLSSCFFLFVKSLNCY